MKLLKRPTDYKSIAQVKKNIPIFFELDTVQVFNTEIVAQPMRKHGLFLTQETPRNRESPFWTVRRALDIFQSDDGKYRPVILNVLNGFGGYDTLREATEAVDNYERILDLRGMAVLTALSQECGGAAGWCAIVSPRGGATLVAANNIHAVHESQAKLTTTGFEDGEFTADIARIDFASVRDLRKCLTAGSSPVTEEWVSHLLESAGVEN